MLRISINDLDLLNKADDIMYNLANQEDILSESEAFTHIKNIHSNYIALLQIIDVMQANNKEKK